MFNIANLLEGVELGLPPTVQFKPHLNASEDHLLPAFEVDTKLDNVSIVHRISFTFLAGRTEANVVQKRARAAFHILDVPFSVLMPELAVPTADNLGLEPDRCGRGLVRRRVGHCLSIALGVATDTDRLGACGQIAGNWRKGE